MFKNVNFTKATRILDYVLIIIHLTLEKTVLSLVYLKNGNQLCLWLLYFALLLPSFMNFLGLYKVLLSRNQMGLHVSYFSYSLSVCMSTGPNADLPWSPMVGHTGGACCSETSSCWLLFP